VSPPAEGGPATSVVGWRCAVCDATVDIAEPLRWRCPNATDSDRRHLLQIVRHAAPAVSGPDGGNSFLDHDHEFAWSAYAAANGMSAAARKRLVTELDTAVCGVAGVGFASTPYKRSGALSDELGFDRDGGVWVKDETGAVAGSHKARHLFTILLHLRAAEELGHLNARPPLAIASCGNAALAAATLASAAAWPIDVYVPTWMSEAFGRRLDELGAHVHRCERRDFDPPGDPAMLRFREAVGGGSIPFTVQGPENAFCLDGGRTIGWEICEQSIAAGDGPLDRVFVQVGGGAFASCLGVGYRQACGAGRLHAVQAAGCAPLVRAWERLGARTDLGAAWAEVMTVWESPHSVADGILDDETYDWIGVVEAMRAGGGSPVVVSEQELVEAHAMAHRAGFDASETGSAGLAGLIRIGDEVDSSERVAVVMSGVTR
jgi:threonine synthase